jgi:hypothetical protein
LMTFSMATTVAANPARSQTIPAHHRTDLILQTRTELITQITATVRYSTE